MFLYFLVTEFVDLVDESGEEITVMRHDDQGAIELFQGIFQDVLGTEVEMVGRLVENQQVHGRETT